MIGDSASIYETVRKILRQLGAGKTKTQLRASNYHRSENEDKRKRETLVV